MSEEEKKVNTEEEQKDNANQATDKPANIEPKPQPEEPKAEPKKGILKRFTESKVGKVIIGGAVVVGTLIVGERIGEAKERSKRSESEIIDAEPIEYSDNDDETVE